ncbi:MAG TPA: S8 family serine peptidase [Candidatus Kapabacteria bacterium]|nr:S8 family serine peptidase [Candidatus Kapabacteria bacterium]
MASLPGIIALDSLTSLTEGRPEIVVGIIDGPVDTGHPDLRETRISPVGTATPAGCTAPSSFACMHGTFVAGIIGAQRGSQAPAIAPGCTMLVRTIFCEAPDPRQCPAVRPTDLAEALHDTIDAGAAIINLSLGANSTAIEESPTLTAAFNRARSSGVLIVVAAGNHGRIGRADLFDHPWLVPVAACDAGGSLLRQSNLGAWIGRRGLAAPGTGVLSTVPGQGYTTMSGTSVAAPFVTATAALLWSVKPSATAATIRRALLIPGIRRRSIVPPTLNAAASLAALQSL